MRTVETRDAEVRDVSPLLGGGGAVSAHLRLWEKVSFFSFLNLFFLLQIIKESTTEHQDLP